MFLKYNCVLLEFQFRPEVLQAPFIYKNNF